MPHKHTVDFQVPTSSPDFRLDILDDINHCMTSKFLENLARTSDRRSWTTAKYMTSKFKNLVGLRVEVLDVKFVLGR